MFRKSVPPVFMLYTIEMRSLLLYFLLFVNPFIVVAQSANPSSAPTGGLQLVIVNTLKFINTSLIPFILGIGFLFLAINVVRYFVIGGANDDSREKAKSLALYSVLAFVLIIVFWGIVNLLAQSIGLEGEKAPIPDYVKLNTPST